MHYLCWISLNCCLVNSTFCHHNSNLSFGSHSYGLKWSQFFTTRVSSFSLVAVSFHWCAFVHLNHCFSAEPMFLLGGDNGHIFLAFVSLSATAVAGSELPVILRELCSGRPETHLSVFQMVLNHTDTEKWKVTSSCNGRPETHPSPNIDMGMLNSRQ